MRPPAVLDRENQQLAYQLRRSGRNAKHHQLARIIDTGRDLMSERVVEIAPEIIVHLAVSDRRACLSIKRVETIIRGVEDNAAPRYCGIARNRASRLFDIILAKIPN